MVANMSVWAFTPPGLPSLTTLTQEEGSFTTYQHYICCLSVTRHYPSDHTNIGAILLNIADVYIHYKSFTMKKNFTKKKGKKSLSNFPSQAIIAFPP